MAPVNREAARRSPDPPRSHRREDVLTTLQYGLRLLELIAAQRTAPSAKELALLLEISLGRCYRLLRTFEQGGFVVRLPGGSYTLGGRIPLLEDSLRAHLTPDPMLVALLDALYAEVGHWVSFNTWEGRDIVIADARWDGPPRIAVGYRDQVHARGATKAILSFLPPPKVRMFFVGRRLEQCTPHTITDLDRLLEDLRRAADRGYAVDREEFMLGYCGLGAPILGPSRFPVGSFGAATVEHDFDSCLDQICRALVRAAELASRHLGYTGSYPPRSPRVVVRRSHGDEQAVSRRGHAGVAHAPRRLGG